MTTKTDRREQAKAMQETIAAEVAALRASDKWHALLDYMAHMHAYSLNNILLIASQRPGARVVMGYRKWQALGRQVRKGESAIRIFGYAVKKHHSDDEDAEETITVYYPILSVFDISQTDLIDPDDPRALPVERLTGERLTGDDPAGIYDRTAAWLATTGWTTRRAPLDGPDGYTRDKTREIVIDDRLTPAQAAHVLLHEAAHATLHYGITDYAEHRDRYEVEAESVAYVLAQMLGLDARPASVGYIASWSEGDADLIRATAQNVLTGVNTIYDGITASADAAA